MGFIKIISNELVCLKIIPNESAPNEENVALAKAIAGLYRPLADRISFSKRGVRLERKDYVAWESVFRNGAVCSYLVCPKRLADILKFKIHNVWENATIERVNLPPPLNSAKAAVCELRYKRQDIFSLNTDPDTGITEMKRKVAHDLKGSERAVVQVLFEPINQDKWKRRACQTYWRFLRGAMTTPVQIEKSPFGIHRLRVVAGELCQLIIRASGNAPGGGSNQEYGRTPQSRLLLLRKMADPAKPEGTALRTFIRVVAEASDEAQAARVVQAITIAYKQLNCDNELERYETRQFKQNLIKDVNLRRPPLIRMNGNIMSLSECGKLMALS